MCRAGGQPGRQPKHADAGLEPRLAAQAPEAQLERGGVRAAVPAARRAPAAAHEQRAERAQRGGAATPAARRHPPAAALAAYAEMHHRAGDARDECGQLVVLDTLTRAR